LYAIKKIKLDANDSEASKVILREVQALSRLFHQYVVRYYQSWFENSHQDSKNVAHSESESDYETDDSSVESHSYDWLQSAENSSRYLEISFRRNSTPKPLNSKSHHQMILYIQMEYCEKKTLWDMIQGGLVESECWRLFHQILEGLDHIHKVGLIHRDLKPTNIFLDREGNVKIGGRFIY
jgi:translation initiation factor 2-alpha kinase 4